MPDHHSWDEAVSVGTITTSSRTELLVKVCSHDGLAYVELTSFYQKRDDPHPWLAGRRIVLPLTATAKLAELLAEAAERSQTMPSVAKRQDGAHEAK